MAKLQNLIYIVLIFLVGCQGNRSFLNGGKDLFQAWQMDIELRAFPGTFSRDPDNRVIVLEGLANEVLSAQVIVRGKSDIKGLSGQLSDLTGSAGGTIPAGRVRYGAYLPVDETMTLTADPLMEVDALDVPANIAQSVWLTIKVPTETAPDQYRGELRLSAPGQQEVFDLQLEVLPGMLSDPSDWSFYLNIWQDPSGVARAHQVEVWSDEHWAFLEDYAHNFVAHGMDVITASIVYDPWDSQTGYPYHTMVEWNYPGAYELGGADQFSWDFSIFDRYVELMIAAAMDEKIDCFSMVKGPWITTKADIRYFDTESGHYRTVISTLGDAPWREIWSAFLPVFKAHLIEKGWFDRTYLAFDEKPKDEMRVIYDFLIDEAPDFKVSIAGGYPGDERKWSDEVILHIDDLFDEEVLASYTPLIGKMRAEDRYISFYTACEPYYPNVFLFSQLREARLLPWLAWKHNLSGYLRWAVSAFPEDVWTQPNYKWHSGDMYFVYPGEEGPLDGMRWELFRQGIQDYEALGIAQELAEKAGREDLLKRLDSAVSVATTLDDCHHYPYVGEARTMVNEVLREFGRDQ